VSTVHALVVLVSVVYLWYTWRHQKTIGRSGPPWPACGVAAESEWQRHLIDAICRIAFYMGTDLANPIIPLNRSSS